MMEEGERRLPMLVLHATKRRRPIVPEVAMDVVVAPAAFLPSSGPKGGGSDRVLTTKQGCGANARGRNRNRCVARRGGAGRGARKTRWCERARSVVGGAGLGVPGPIAVSVPFEARRVCVPAPPATDGIRH
jgi:hypothetical protein